MYEHEGYIAIVTLIIGLFIGLGLGMKSLKDNAEHKYIEEIDKLRYRIKYLESRVNSKKPTIPIIYP